MTTATRQRTKSKPSVVEALAKLESELQTRATTASEIAREVSSKFDAFRSLGMNDTDWSTVSRLRLR